MFDYYGSDSNEKKSMSFKKKKNIYIYSIAAIVGKDSIRETYFLSTFKHTCKAPLYKRACICELYCICAIYGVARRWKGFYYSQSDAPRHFLDDPFLFRFGTEVGKLVRANMQITLFNQPSFERSRRGDRLREKRFECIDNCTRRAYIMSYDIWRCTCFCCEVKYLEFALEIICERDAWVNE